jgi:hypothetical protein
MKIGKDYKQLVRERERAREREEQTQFLLRLGFLFCSAFAASTHGNEREWKFHPKILSFLIELLN